MNLKILFYLLALTVLFSCNELYDVEVDLSDGFSADIAVSAFLNPDSTVNILFGSTQISFSKKTSSLAQIKTATIQDLTNSVYYHLAVNTNKKGTFLSSTELKPQKGGVYKTKIETSNPSKTIEITDTIPSEEVKIVDVQINPVRKQAAYAGRVSFIPPVSSGKTMYYELLLFSQSLLSQFEETPYYQSSFKSGDQLITCEDYYPNVLLLDADVPASLLFRLNAVNNTVTINFEYSLGEGYSSNNGMSTWDHNLRVQIRSISYAYFHYKTSFYKQQYAAQGDVLYGMAPPVKVYSNAIGGVGIIGSYCKTDTTVFVKGREHIENE